MHRSYHCKATPTRESAATRFAADSYNNMDASVFKNNKINERFNLQLQLQATFFNALEPRHTTAHLTYAIEDAVRATAPSPTSPETRGSNRNVQLGARLLF